MADKKYSLQIELEAQSPSLDKLIEELEHIEKLSQKLKGSVVNIPPADIEKLLEAAEAQEQLNKREREAQKIMADLLKIEQQREKLRREESKTSQQQIKEEKERIRLLSEEHKLRVQEEKDAKKKAVISAKEKADRANTIKGEKELIELFRLESILEDEQSGRLEKLNAENRLLVISRNQLIGTEKDYLEQLTAINAKIDENDKEIKNSVSTREKDRLSVGSYSAAIKDAFKNTGLFNGSLGNIVNNLKAVKENLDKDTESANKFSKVLKLTLVGLAIAAVAAAKELFELNQTALDAKDRTIALAKDVATGTKAYTQLVNATIAWRQELITLNALIQKSKLDQEDFNEISSDTTLGFQARNEALKEAIRLSGISAALDVQKAKGELRLAELAQKKGQADALGGKELKELTEKVAEAKLNLFDAEDKLGDLQRQNATRERERATEETINSIELLRSKKLSAKAEQVQLEEQLADEKKQLEERATIAEKLLDVKKQTVAEELRLFQEGILRQNEGTKQNEKIQIDSANLIAETDAILLAKKIKDLQLGEAATSELAKIIKQAQDNEIENSKVLSDLAKERAERTEKILAIERQISLIKETDRVNDAKREEQERLKIYQLSNDAILQEENLFNETLEQVRQKSFEDAVIRSEKTFEASAELLKKTADAEKEDLKTSESDNLIRAELIKKIDTQLQIDLGNLKQDEVDAYKKLNKQKLDDDKNLNKERLKANEKLLDDLEEQNQADFDRIAGKREKKEKAAADARKKREQEIIDNTDLATSKFFDAQEKRQQQRLSALDKQEEASDKALERQEDRASRGLTNDVETYQKKNAEIEKLRQEEIKKEQRRLKIQSYYNLVSGYAKTDANTALSKAAKDIAISEAVTAAFAEKGGIVGEVRDTAQVGANFISRTHGAGNDRLVVADKREGILSVSQMNNLGGREGFKSLQSMLNKPIHNDILFPAIPVFQSKEAQNNNIEAMLSQLIQVTKDKPVPKFIADGYGNFITQTIEDGVRKSTKDITRKPSWRG